MATTADIKNGLCIELNNDLFQIVEFQHVKPGKGGAFIRTKLKSLTNQRVLDHTFNSGAKLTTARVIRRPYQFLYKDDTGFHFMENETFEQVALDEKLINAPEFLKEGQEVEVVIHDETNTPLSCELPAFMELEVTYTEPGIRGDTATNVTKPATLESGTQVNVPIFVDIGDIVKVDTRDKTYVERVKK